MTTPLSPESSSTDKNAAATQSSFASPPALSLPKGGGAIRGMGEKLAANPVTGTGSLSVPLALSPGRSGFAPQLELSYDSGSGNGPFGLGWNLSLPSISRKTDKGLPRYRDDEESDEFVLSGAEDLVPVYRRDSAGAWTRDERGALVFEEIERDGWRVRKYRPRIEGLFARIERWTQPRTGEVFWRSITRENVTTFYGRDEATRVFDPEDPRRVFSWLVSHSYDDKGNAIVYEYASEDSVGIDTRQAHEAQRTERSRGAARYLKRIRYGNRVPNRDGDWSATDPRLLSDWMFTVVLDYGEGHCAEEPPDPLGRRFATAQLEARAAWGVRPDPFSVYRAGFEVRSYRLCRQVLMFHHFPEELGIADCLVRSTDLAYRESPVASVLTSAVQSSYARRPTADHAARYLEKSMPPLEFDYSQIPTGDELARLPVLSLDAESLENLPAGLASPGAQWVDLDGEGMAGILCEHGGSWYYKRNQSQSHRKSDRDGERFAARFGPLERVATQPSLGATAVATQLLDLSGDGQIDVVQLDGPVRGFYERTPDRCWASFRPFASWPNLDSRNPNLRFVDLTGDGHADVLITEGEAISVYPSLGEEGLGPSTRLSLSLDEERGPRLVFDDGTQSIYLADLSGDGLSDLVRVRNGEVCYWPNLGYGRFGARVTMDNPPWFDADGTFDQRRIRLLDADGSGTTDILYLGSDGARIYFNQSGNRWSEAAALPQFPRLDDLSNVTAVDLLGNGTGCLVWSSLLPGDASRPMHYVDLMAGQKPHLLVSVINNLGAETLLRYAPSTRFYVEDGQAGRPWITRVPFPVHVVERIETYDRVSRNRFVTRYAYHHGFFDGEEREFRGFGMVEQWDTEEYAVLGEDGEFPAGDNVDASSHLPPVLTRTWFHTGSYFEGGAISRQFELEYFREPGLTDEERRAMLLDDTVLPEGLSTRELREACRALKGSVLRQEVYALDGSEKADRPYTVSERNYSIEFLQPRERNRHAVFFAHAREAVDFHYERVLREQGGRLLADPRVTHAVTLAVDMYGNVLESLAIAYGRRFPDLSLDLRDQAEQGKRHLLLAHNGYTKAVIGVDVHRAPASAESRSYELLRVPPPGGGGSGIPTRLFAFDELRSLTASLADGRHDLPYEDVDGTVAVEAHPYRRLIERARTLYRRDDLNGPLPLGVLESLGLPHEACQLAFTPGLLTGAYGDRVSPSMLAEAGYREDETDGTWWIPSGRVFFSAAEEASAAEELAEARQHFFQPRRYRDPFGAPTTVELDRHDLLLVRSIDAVGNVSRAENDYRLLQPWGLVDPNGNRTEVAFDALGMVVGVAVMGKGSEGDSLADFEPDLDEETLLDQLGRPLQDPHALLASASSRVVYDLFAYLRSAHEPQPRPTVAWGLAREIHVADLAEGEQARLQHSIAYSDGFGRVIQTKAQAEPGPLAPGDVAVSPRWVASGWTIFNNKGKPVRQYEPFFTADHGFELARLVGVSPILLYDPPGRVVATVQPNHAIEKVVFDPWRHETWDGNDTVLLDPCADADLRGLLARLPEADFLPTWHAQRAAGAMGPEERAAALSTVMHAATPAVAHLDALGRAFVSRTHNRYRREPGGETVDETYATRTRFDVEGNALEVHDAKDRMVMRYAYDLLGRRLHQASMEAGERWLLDDVAGKTLYGWDSRGHRIHNEYDLLRRPLAAWVTGADAADPHRAVLVGRTEYGEGHPQSVSLNLRTRVFRQYDAAGVVTNERFDFKGNLLESRRRLTVRFDVQSDWSGEPEIEAEVFVTSTEYDALNRPVTITPPDQSVIRPAYNEAGLLESVEAHLRGARESTPFVDGIDYDAKGQRQSIVYGNGVQTSYEYDPLTFRLRRLRSLRGSERMQDLAYAYDAVGNITAIGDEAQQTVFFDNAEVEPHASYTYDALYRLVTATGREHVGQLGQPHTTWDDRPRIGLTHPNDGQAMRTYTERYVYDPVGNILQMIHSARDGTWNRTYAYEEASLVEADCVSNRLTRTSVGEWTEAYTHDAHGNMTSMPHLAQMAWDYRDQLQEVDLRGGGTATYVYDGGGQRVRKVIRAQGGSRQSERIYLGLTEVYREYTGGELSLERETLHVMDGEQRIALVETRTRGTDASVPQLVRYQLGNHLGSASLELDAEGEIISYEEYYPYGSTSYQAARADVTTPKRYRYTAMERDEETGLNYHTARYYAPWLGRWCSVDPVQAKYPEWGSYAYAFACPIRFLDPSGHDPDLVRLGDAADAATERAVTAQGNLQRALDDLARCAGDAAAARREIPSLEAQARAGILSAADQTRLQALVHTSHQALLAEDAVSNAATAAREALAQSDNAAQNLSTGLEEARASPSGVRGGPYADPLAGPEEQLANLRRAQRDLTRFMEEAGQRTTGRLVALVRRGSAYLNRLLGRGGGSGGLPPSPAPPALPPAGGGAGTPPALPPAGGSPPSVPPSGRSSAALGRARVVAGVAGRWIVGLVGTLGAAGNMYNAYQAHEEGFYPGVVLNVLGVGIPLLDVFGLAYGEGQTVTVAEQRALAREWVERMHPRVRQEFCRGHQGHPGCR